MSNVLPVPNKLACHAQVFALSTQFIITSKAEEVQDQGKVDDVHMLGLDTSIVCMDTRHAALVGTATSLFASRMFKGWVGLQAHASI